MNTGAILGKSVFNDVCKKIGVEPATIYKITITCKPITVEIETDGIARKHLEWLDVGFGKLFCEAIGINPDQANELVIIIEEDSPVRMVVTGFVPKKAFDIEFPLLEKANVTNLAT